MSLHIHRLDGCSPVPLAHYLKALGILRLVSEQKDQSARGWWQDEKFFLATKMNQKDLIDFFLYDYEPTPIIAPWNGGSGFYPKDKKDGIQAIAESKAKRFYNYRAAIQTAVQLVGDREKPPADKNKFLILCRNSWTGELLKWLEAALVIGVNGKASYPAMLGTGGNDGRLDFTNNFMQRLAELFLCDSPEAHPGPDCERLCLNACFSRTITGLSKNAIGQFLPGMAGGVNSSTGFGGDGYINKWDFILMLEGCILFSASVSRRASIDPLPQAAAPFAFRSTASGYDSAAKADEGSRGEQWLPLWKSPSTGRAVQQIITEGRASLGHQKISRSVDFARSIARLGVNRGIAAFQRYGYIERNGQANLATPLGRWQVSRQPHQNLIDRIAPWVERLRRASSAKNAPASFERAARTCEEAILSCCRNGHLPLSWQDLLISLGSAEQTLLRSPAFTARKYLRPLPGLEPAWIEAMQDMSTELRMATAFAAQHGCDNHGRILWHDPVRRHLLPLMKNKKGNINTPHRFQTAKEGLQHDADVVFKGRNLLTDCCAVLQRRIMFRPGTGLPLAGPYAVEAGLADIVLFLSERVDVRRMAALAWPLTAVQWGKELPKAVSQPHCKHRDNSGLLDLYGLLRLTHLPAGLLKLDNTDITIRCDPAILQNLVTGQAGRAVAIACRRLQSSGLRPYLQTAVADTNQAIRLAASLAFPLKQTDIVVLARRLTMPAVKKEQV